MTRTLTIQEATNIATVVDWAQRTARIGWLDEEDGKLRTGTVRSIGTEDGYFLNADEDVRDSFVRITTSSGFELFKPMSEVLALVAKSYMVEEAV